MTMEMEEMEKVRLDGLKREGKAPVRCSQGWDEERS
jgi:hypothetical protein